VTISLAVFIGYVASTMRLLQVAWVISDVAARTLRSIALNYPRASAYGAARAPDLAGPHRPVAAAGRGRMAGILQGVDHERLVRIAQRRDCVLQLLVRIGEYVPGGSEVLIVYERAAAAVPDRRAADRAILAGLNLGRNRTLYQDSAYGLRQLVDIAIQSLSPAINQPTTAVQVIDRIEDVVRRLAASQPRSGYYADASGDVRFIEPVMSFDDCLDLAFTEITSYGAGSAQVVRRLLAAYDTIGAALDPELRPGIAVRREALLIQSAELGVAAAHLRPDPLGLG
jgi:uncharacterized membrane protein